MEGLACSWGDNPLAPCREALTCQKGSWQQGETWGQCPAPGAITCPEQPPADGSSCEGAGSTYGPCGWGDGTQCACSCSYWGGPCPDGAAKHWICTPPPAGCPPVIPNSGEACSSDGTSCKYGVCGAMATCSGGAWAWSYSPCPK